MIVAAHQPQYLPWLGYFDKIARADVFVLIDDVQFKKNEWQNRNRIKTSQGWQWLTVPVRYKYPQLILEVEINNDVKWRRKHRQALVTNYAKARYHQFLEDFLHEVYSFPWTFISELNISLVKTLTKLLGIETSIFVSSELGQFPQDRDERLIAITQYFGADTYLGGNGGRQYMNLEKYQRNGIKVMFQDYKHPVYKQLFGEFEPYMSIIDLILNHGYDSLDTLRGNS
jgi:hypothetical protein